MAESNIQETRRAIKPLNSVLVKPAGADCNLGCGYCFYLKKTELYPDKKQRRMSLEVLEELIRQSMENSGSQISFGWQGGEPTLMGVDFYRKVVEFQQKYGRSGQSVGNGIQTNGILINHEWADLFLEFNFLVGLSLDGPRHIHDKYRVNRGGLPTWEKVTKNAKLMISRGVPVNALTVINDYSWQYPEEIYDFHRSLGLTYMQFIPCVETDPDDPTHEAPFSVKPEQYGEFLCRVFDRWCKDIKNGRARTSVRFFDSLLHTYLGMPAPECTLLPECGVYVIVEHNGDVYSCDFFVEPDWKLGNIMENDILEMLNSPRQREFGMMKRDLPPECTTCKFLRNCFGGCTKDRLRNPMTHKSNHFCKAYLRFFEHADERLRQLADQIARQQQMGGPPPSTGKSSKKRKKKRR
ncbi:MAG: anaerobic sulfatase maturase [Candidatus Sumerlaeia bacterium]